MNKSFFLFSFVLSCCQAGFFLLSSTSAAIIQVPSDTATIRGAVSLASTGDTILVADGTYYENILVRGKALTLASYFILDNDSNHIINTIIDGSQPNHPDSGTVILFTAGPSESSLVCGFTITGGSGTVVVPDVVRSGGGLVIENSGCEVRNNVIRNNIISVTGDIDSYGAGIATYNETGVVIIRNNQIYHNQIECNSGGGGAIALYSREVVLVENNLIRNNIFRARGFAPGGGLYLNGDETFNGPMTVSGNVIAHNETHTTSSVEVSYGGGIFIGNPNTVLLNNTFVRNSATTSGGGIYIAPSNPLIMNSIMWENIAPTGSQIAAMGNIQVVYSNVQDGWSGKGNISKNPQFADTMLHLLSSSPCIGLGRASFHLGGITYYASMFDLEENPRPNPVDTLVDMGAYETTFPARAHLVYSILNNNIGYIHPSQDSVGIGVQLLNPHLQDIFLFARMTNLQGVVWDELQLFDDGQHGDSLAGDDYFGAILAPVMLEDAFHLSYRLINSTFQDTFIYQGEQQITSIGPLVCEGNQIVSHSGNRIQLELVLRNQGLQATATEVRAELIPRDSSVVQIINNNESFGDIPAGGTAVNSNAYVIDTIENPGTLSFDIRISMGGYTYWVQEGMVVGIEPISRQLPGEFALYQNYSNPFNPTTIISWQLAVGNLVQLSIYDLSGREVKVLVNEKQSAGYHQIEFDGSDLASGVYFYRLRAGEFVQIRKALLLK